LRSVPIDRFPQCGQMKWCSCDIRDLSPAAQDRRPSAVTRRRRRLRNPEAFLLF
jgi:hypothetical protein